METGQLTSKELKDQDLIAIHKELFRKLIKEKIQQFAHRRIAMRFYEVKINIHNIRDYYNHPITIFAQALLQDNLDGITKYQSF